MSAHPTAGSREREADLCQVWAREGHPHSVRKGGKDGLVGLRHLPGHAIIVRIRYTEEVVHFAPVQACPNQMVANLGVSEGCHTVQGIRESRNRFGPVRLHARARPRKVNRDTQDRAPRIWGPWDNGHPG